MSAITLLMFAASGPLQLAAVADMGVIQAGAPLAHSFTLSNSSNELISLDGVDASCGCTRTAFATRRLTPGQSTTLTVEINTLAHAAGPWAWMGTVRYHTPSRSFTRNVRLTGTLIREVAVVPPALGLSLESGGIVQEITITDSRAKPLAIETVSASSPHLAVSFSGLNIRIAIDAALPAGTHRETIVITTNDPIYREFHVPVTIEKGKPQLVKAYPEEIVFDDESARVSLRRSDGKPLTISDCVPSSDSVRVKWAKGSMLAPLIQVTRIGDAEQTGELRVTLSEPAGETVVIPVRAAKR